MPKTRGTCLDDPWVNEDDNPIEDQSNIDRVLSDNHILTKIKSHENAARQLMLIDATLVGLFIAFATNNISISVVNNAIRSYLTDPYVNQQTIIFHSIEYLHNVGYILVIILFGFPLFLLISSIHFSWNNLRITEITQEKDKLLKRSYYCTISGIFILFLIFIIIYGFSIYDSTTYGEGVRGLAADGNSLNTLGSYENASLIFDKVIMVNPSYAPGWEGKAEALAGLGRYNESIKAFNVALKNDENNTAALVNKGLVLEKLGMNKLAIEHFKKAVQIDPSTVAAWVDMGSLLEDYGDHDAAIKAYDNAIKNDPLNEYAWNNKGFSFYEQGKYDEALQAYDKAIEINPKSVLAWNNKGFSFYEQGKYDEAVKAFETAVEIYPLSAEDWNKTTDKSIAIEYWNTKGKALNAIGKTVEADAAVAEAKKLGYKG